MPERYDPWVGGGGVESRLLLKRGPVSRLAGKVSDRHLGGRQMTIDGDEVRCNASGHALRE